MSKKGHIKKPVKKSSKPIFLKVGRRTLITGENLRKIFGIKLIGKENAFCDLDYWLNVLQKLTKKKGAVQNAVRKFAN